MMSKKELAKQYFDDLKELSSAIKSLDIAGNDPKTMTAKLDIIKKFSSLPMDLASVLINMSEDELTSSIQLMREMTLEIKTLSQQDSPSTKVCGVCYGKKEFPCSGCYESGACQLCNGQGEIRAMVGVNKDGDEIIRKTPCPACKGSGLCTICHGTKIMKCTDCGGTGLASG